MLIVDSRELPLGADADGEPSDVDFPVTTTCNVVNRFEIKMERLEPTFIAVLGQINGYLSTNAPRRTDNNGDTAR